MVRRSVVLLIVAALAAACTGGSITETPADLDTGDSNPEPVALSPSPGVERSDPVADAPVDALVTGFNDAGFELWRTQAETENLVFSPTSIGNAVLMARAAADDPTRMAIDDAFSLPGGRSAHEAWNSAKWMIELSARSQSDLTVTIADRIWPRVDVSPNQEWIDLLASEHGATLETLDYVDHPDSSRQRINSWVSDQTGGLIPELLPRDFIDPLTVLVLTDTLYFKAQWATVFGKYQNVDDVFTRLDGTVVDVEYLRELELNDLRGEGDGFAGAEIPYVGGDFSMLVIVPDEGRFDEIRRRLDQGLLAAIDATFTTGPYELLVPKWETTTQLDLLDWLTEMGAAPGSYPAIGPDVFIDAAVHGADITVDEWGTVAAAATAFGFEESGPPEPELTVKADRPFLFLIRHRPTGLVLFAGQVTDPTG